MKKSGTRKQRQAEEEKFNSARQLEIMGELPGAITAYEQILKKNPLHIDATSRLLILYRKMKNIPKEISLLSDAIASHEAHVESSQRAWIMEHEDIAERSRPLAKMLGLLNAKELPFYEHEVVEKWKKRLEAAKKRCDKKKEKQKTNIKKQGKIVNKR